MPKTKQKYYTVWKGHKTAMNPTKASQAFPLTSFIVPADKANALVEI